MTRELKFRVRCKKTNQLVCCYSEGLRFTLDTGQLYGDCGLNVTDYYNIEQYTGRKDEDGIEIYEDDICKLRDPRTGEWSDQGAPVFFNQGYVGGWVIGNSCDYVSLGQRHSEEVKLIGNIHQNPELLK